MSEKPTRTEESSPAREGETARQLIRRAKRASHRKFPAEEKIRIVMEGIRAEVSVVELCRRLGITAWPFSAGRRSMAGSKLAVRCG